ncbi:MAG: precorrin-6Y C5,15-methyltransferase (decarboxylating) subunit CbiT, partial [Lachnospiraceae bacterium]|nr:precorrin-6Y C5,15-methyltransferase (decarboxylating) subunit CbiT [Lachnospiraceae bacterium]
VTDPLSLLLVQPKGNGKVLRSCGIADDDFIRGDVPITKSEVRAVTMSRLAVGHRDVVYDIGAGTGSVSVECSTAAAYGEVYAIEKEEKALELLQKNKTRFLCRNLQIVAGTAPEVLAELPKPDKAFIGGSGGKMKDILKCLKQKNPVIHVVINAAALETLQESIKALKEAGFTEPEISQLCVSRSVTRGRYHMMEGLNPVYVITAEGKGGEV